MTQPNLDPRSLEDSLMTLAALGLLEMEGRMLEEEYAAFCQGHPELPPTPEQMDKLERTLRRRRRAAAIRTACQKAAPAVTKAAVLFLVLSVGMGAAFVTSADAREMVYRLLFSREERYSQVVIPEDLPPASAYPEYAEAGARYAPAFLPEGMELIHTEVAGTDMMIMEYENNEGKYILFGQTRITENSVIRFDTEDTDLMEEVMIGNCAGLLIVKSGYTHIVWQNEDTFFSVATDLPRGTAVQIAESIVEL